MIEASAETILLLFLVGGCSLIMLMIMAAAFRVSRFTVRDLFVAITLLGIVLGTLAALNGGRFGR